MKKIEKVYEAVGLLEYHMTVSAGGVCLQISFTGGAMGSNGIIPGRFTTQNAALQHLIENSGPYLKNRIRKRSEREVEEKPAQTAGAENQ